MSCRLVVRFLVCRRLSSVLGCPILSCQHWKLHPKRNQTESSRRPLPESRKLFWWSSGWFGLWILRVFARQMSTTRRDRGMSSRASICQSCVISIYVLHFCCTWTLCIIMVLDM